MNIEQEKINQQKLVNMIRFVEERHFGQKRKSYDLDFTYHLYEIMLILSNAGVTDKDILMAGLGHDLIEDTDTTQDEIRKQFGDKVTNIILDCTDDRTTKKKDRKLHQIKIASQLDINSRLVKLADKISNLQSLLIAPPKKWDSQRLYGYILWSRKVVLELQENLITDKNRQNPKIEMFNKLIKNYIEIDFNVELQYGLKVDTELFLEEYLNNL
jgi:GTP diphosphokinase / guanosine-3',5'-bis(diphosphate) 3'-diphosphatase